MPMTRSPAPVSSPEKWKAPVNINGHQTLDTRKATSRVIGLLYYKTKAKRWKIRVCGEVNTWQLEALFPLLCMKTLGTFLQSFITGANSCCCGWGTSQILFLMYPQKKKSKLLRLVILEALVKRPDDLLTCLELSTKIVDGHFALMDKGLHLVATAPRLHQYCRIVVGYCGQDSFLKIRWQICILHFYA